MSGLFDDQPPPPLSIRELAKGARRELRMRESVYPRWVANGKMTQARADYELRVMREIAERLEALQ